ncbi:MAG: pyridoxamine 5'-phosphate oxidase family protein [Pseudobdellovibrionaceae bacterium]
MKLKVEELNSSVQKLGEMIKDIKIAMLTTSNSEGKVHSRPMMTQEIEFDGDLWFFTSISSGKMFELESSQEVNVAYSSPEHSRYVSVSGQAEVVRDRAKAEELWNPLYKTWFKQGLEDPDLVLLKVKVDSAEY